MNRLSRLVAPLVLAAACPFVGCVMAAEDPAPEALAQAEQALDIFNVSYKVTGFLVESLGHGLNGTALNGTVLDGHSVLYAPLSEVTRGDAEVTEVKLEGTEFSGRLDGKKRIRGRAFEGAQFAAMLEDGTPLSLRIEAIERSEETANKDVWLHWVSYATQDGQQPLCGVDELGNAIPSIPLKGRPDTNVGAPGGGGWVDDANVVTFACAGYVLAKCVELGYKPWREGRICSHPGGCETVSLAAHHQACTRMLRADYCGNGESHTTDGIIIGLYDAFGIRLDGEDWPIEAEWTPAGARCASRPRVESLPLPECWSGLADPTCGDVSHFNEGTLIITELAP